MRDIINVNISLNNIVCHDEGDGFGNAEPYLWTVFFKIDGTTVSLNDSLNLVGTATIQSTPGSHGNLGDTDVDEGDTVTIPSIIGKWDTTLTPIPVPKWVKDLGTDDVAAVAGVICVLMEEDNVTDSGAEAGHSALNSAVQAALDNIVNSLGFSHQEVTDGDIEALTDSISSQVSSAIQNSQNVFENIWSWLNEDDTIGSVVFRFDQDTLLVNGTTNLNHRWKNEGDWEINGHINASVKCSSEALKAVAAILNALFSSDSEKEMKDFRKSDYQKYKNLHEWWELSEKNSPYLIEAIRNNPKLLNEAIAIQSSVSQLLRNRDAVIDKSFWDSSQIIMESILKTNQKNRHVRKDLTRALDIISVLRSKTLNQVFETLNTIQPARHPKIRSAGGKVRICKVDVNTVKI
jgi:hypothetical protein